MSNTGYTSVAQAQKQGYTGPTASIGGGGAGGGGFERQAMSVPTPGWQMPVQQRGGGPGGAPGSFGRNARMARTPQNPDYERPTVDCNPSIIRYLQSRVFQWPGQDYNALQPDLEYMRDLMPPAGIRRNPSNAYCTHHCHTAVNREKFPVYCAQWTPEGRRVITGAQSGEFTRERRQLPQPPPAPPSPAGIPR